MVSTPQTDDESSLSEYARLLWHRRWLVVFAVLIAVAAALAYCVISTKQYQATATLQVTQALPPTNIQANGNLATLALVDVPTDIQVLESATIKDIVAKTIPNPPKVSATEISTTDVVNVNVTDSNAALAAKAATAYANAYVQYEHTQIANTMNAAVSNLQSRLNTIQGTITSLNNEITQDAAGKTPVAGVESALATLEGSLQLDASNINNVISEDQLFATSQSGEGGVVLAGATVPTKPSSPKIVEYTIIAAVLGLVIGIGLALAIEFFDDRIKSSADLERSAHNQPLLGLIPQVSSWRSVDTPYLVTLAKPQSLGAEAYRGLRTSIQFLGVERSIRTLQISSPGDSEGKTTTLANLGVVTAQAGVRVVMVSCDLRHPRLHDFFGLSNQSGFTSVLLGQVTADAALQAVPGFDNLKLLASGPVPPNPAELLASAKAGDVLAELAGQADLVLVDTPPVVPLSDAATVAGRVDSVLLVVAAGSSHRGQLEAALQRLEQVDAPIMGMVLNGADESPDSVTWSTPAARAANGARQSARANVG